MKLAGEEFGLNCEYESHSSSGIVSIIASQYRALREFSLYLLTNTVRSISPTQRRNMYQSLLQLRNVAIRDIFCDTFEGVRRS